MDLIKGKGVQSQMDKDDQHDQVNNQLDLTLRLGGSIVGSTSSQGANSSSSRNNKNPSCPLHAGLIRRPLYEFPPPPKWRNYCVINLPNGRAKTGGSRKRNPTGRRPAKAPEQRACTNYNCCVTESPMWRKGPLGPKTLCNRCGIRYRKEKIKEQKQKKAVEEARQALMQRLHISKL